MWYWPNKSTIESTSEDEMILSFKKKVFLTFRKSMDFVWFLAYNSLMNISRASMIVLIQREFKKWGFCLRTVQPGIEKVLRSIQEFKCVDGSVALNFS